jgi:hypothetical protein
LDKIYQRKRIGNNGFFLAWYFIRHHLERETFIRLKKCNNLFCVR